MASPRREARDGLEGSGITLSPSQRTPAMSSSTPLTVMANQHCTASGPARRGTNRHIMTCLSLLRQGYETSGCIVHAAKSLLGCWSALT